jgi:predicted dehydrogenase
VFHFELKFSWQTRVTTMAKVIVVGCGIPGKSMGHYHCYQIVEQDSCPSASLSYVVEPWFMSEAGCSAPGSQVFNAWRKEMEVKHSVQFFANVEEIPSVDSSERRLAIISARTADNPKLFEQCLKIGCHSIYLEKPGAPSVRELEHMRDAAKEAGVTVLMGFNKNVAKYSNLTMSNALATCGTVTFVHNNDYSKDDLGECFERNSEGMLKNMAIHELALLVTFFGVTTNTIKSVIADKDNSSCQTLVGPSGKEFTDFDKIKFTVITTTGTQVSILADRCGGNDSVGIVTNHTGEELARYSMPDEEDIIKMKKLEAENPGANAYFYVQDPDYAMLKERIAKHCVDGTPAEGVATIDIAVETLKVAEYLTPLLMEQLL